MPKINFRRLTATTIAVAATAALSLGGAQTEAWGGKHTTSWDLGQNNAGKATTSWDVNAGRATTSWDMNKSTTSWD